MDHNKLYIFKSEFAEVREYSLVSFIESEELFIECCSLSNRCT